MTSTNVLTDAEFAGLLRGFEHTAFRLELQRAYLEPDEHDTVARFLAGDKQEPIEVASLRAWFVQVAQQTRQGKRIERVRVHDNPPTDYQRWERWIGAWNTKAGETIGYMTRGRAHEIGLLPKVGTVDWWLLDSARLIVMSFDDQGHRLTSELVTEPYRVVQACAWRDMAIHYSAPNEGQP